LLYRFTFDFSDIDRGIYETLEFRVVQHPSEIATYLLTRVLAYALSYEEGLDFMGAGLSDPDTPALKKTSMNGQVNMWVEIGNPSIKKLHKAGKVSERVIVYTYKSADVLMTEINNNEIHRKNELEVYAIDSKFLDELEKKLKKSNNWSLLYQQGQLDIHIENENYSTEVKKYVVRT
jgi:uncharacterized protein YaeQ